MRSRWRAACCKRSPSTPASGRTPCSPQNARGPPLLSGAQVYLPGDDERARTRGYAPGVEGRGVAHRRQETAVRVWKARARARIPDRQIVVECRVRAYPVGRDTRKEDRDRKIVNVSACSGIPCGGRRRKLGPGRPCADAVRREGREVGRIVAVASWPIGRAVSSAETVRVAPSGNASCRPGRWLSRRNPRSDAAR
jgi:hypothetical protein